MFQSSLPCAPAQSFVCCPGGTRCLSEDTSLCPTMAWPLADARGKEQPNTLCRERCACSFQPPEDEECLASELCLDEPPRALCCVTLPPSISFRPLQPPAAAGGVASWYGDISHRRVEDGTPAGGTRHRIRAHRAEGSDGKEQKRMGETNGSVLCASTNGGRMCSKY